MKAIVIYTSKYGSTEKYAQWISEALNCPMKKQQNVSFQELAAYDTVIYGGGVYASSIAGFKKFLVKLGQAKNKRLALFMVGMTNPKEKGFYEKVAEQNIPVEWKGHFAVFSFRGDQLYSQMNGLHKLIMRIPKRAAEKKPHSERTVDDNLLIENFGSDIIFTSKEQIEPILDYFKEA